MTARPRKMIPAPRTALSSAPIIGCLRNADGSHRRLQSGDPVKGFIWADEVTRTYVPWLSGPVGMITAATLDALAAALRTEMDL